MLTSEDINRLKWGKQYKFVIVGEECRFCPDHENVKTLITAEEEWKDLKGSGTIAVYKDCWRVEIPYSMAIKRELQSRELPNVVDGSVCYKEQIEILNELIEVKFEERS